MRCAKGNSSSCYNFHWTFWALVVSRKDYLEKKLLGAPVSNSVFDNVQQNLVPFYCFYLKKSCRQGSMLAKQLQTEKKPHNGWHKCDTGATVCLIFSVFWSHTIYLQQKLYDEFENLFALSKYF